MIACDPHFLGPGVPGIVFYRMLAIAHRHALSLAKAINQLDFMNAWLDSMELFRSVDLAVMSLGMLSPADRGESDERLARLWIVVQRLRSMAPRPSDTAIAQGRATGIPARRNAWGAERRAWIVERRSHGPILISFSPEGLTMASGADA
jgi:hypothetical protein